MHGTPPAHFDVLSLRRGTPAFVAFDVLALNGRDLRALPLVRRKALLWRMGARDRHELMGMPVPTT